MILAIDVHYKETYAKAVGVLFDWDDEKPIDVITTTISEVAEYETGQFYKRELPCILKLLEKVDLQTIECIIIDGHVYVNNDKSFGLGGYLFKELGCKIPIIGLAKKSFINTEKVSFPIFRGQSKIPLYVSSIDFNIKDAMKKIKNMQCNYRIPTLLKYLDTLTKEK